MYALIKNSIVENIIVADFAFVQGIAADWDDIIELDTEEKQKAAHVNGTYVAGVFAAPAIPVLPEVIQPVIPDPAEWLIDIGPFFDRFGATKMAVLTSSDVGVKALITDIQIRKWVDLTRQDVVDALAYIGSIVATVTPELQTAILTTAVAADENLALRKLYFS